MSPAGAADLSVGTGQNSNRSSISVRFPRKDQDIRPGDRDDDLAMHLVKGHLVVAVVIRALDLRVRSLNKTRRRLFSIGSAAAHQDRWRQRTVHDDFIVDRIVRQTV